MRELIRSKVFGATFFVVYFVYFVISSSISWWDPHIAVGSTNYGFPFTQYSSHCFGGGYVIEGLAGNAIFASVAASGLAFLAASLSGKFSTPEFRRKWYL